MRLAVVVATLLLASSPVAGQRLRPIDYGMAAAGSALLVVDYVATFPVTSGTRTEHNRLLGPHPTVGGLTAYFGAYLAANVAVGAIRRPWLRRALWAGIIASEALAVGYSFGGYRLQVRFL